MSKNWRCHDVRARRDCQRAIVRKFFEGANPIGRRLRLISPQAGVPDAAWREIVGVVPDLGLSAGDQQLAGGVNVPLTTDEASVDVAKRSLCVRLSSWRL